MNAFQYWQFQIPTNPADLQKVAPLLPKAMVQTGNAAVAGARDSAALSRNAEFIMGAQRMKTAMREAIAARDTARYAALVQEYRQMGYSQGVKMFNPLALVADEFAGEAVEDKLQQGSLDRINTMRKGLGLADIPISRRTDRAMMLELFSKDPDVALMNFNAKLEQTNELRKQHGMPPVSMSTMTFMMADQMDPLGTDALSAERVKAVMNIDWESPMSGGILHSMDPDDALLRPVRMDYLNRLRNAAGAPPVDEMTYKAIEAHPERPEMAGYDFGHGFSTTNVHRQQGGLAPLTWPQYLYMLKQGGMNPRFDPAPAVPQDFVHQNNTEA